MALRKSHQLYIIASALGVSACLLGALWAVMRVCPLLWAAGLDAFMALLVLVAALRKSSEVQAGNETDRK